MSDFQKPTSQTTERPDYWDGYHQAMLGHPLKPDGGSEYQRGYAEGEAAFARKVENQHEQS